MVEIEESELKESVWHKKPIFALTMLVVFPPYGIFLTWKCKEMSFLMKLTLTFILIVSVYFFFSGKPQKKVDVIQNTKQASVFVPKTIN